MNPQRTLLVPDPVYLPLDQAGSATNLVKSLLDGPTRWLRPAVESMIPCRDAVWWSTRFPSTTEWRASICRRTSSTPTSSQREQAAAQITTTLLGLSSTVTGVAISVEGSPLQLPAAPAVMTRETWESYDSDQVTPALGAVFVRGGHRATVDRRRQHVQCRATGSGAGSLSWSPHSRGTAAPSRP